MDQLEENDIAIQKLPYFELTSLILGCCFDVMNELGIGFLESVYKNSLLVALQQQGLEVEVEKFIEVYFRKSRVGVYKADLIMNKSVIVEVKCCKSLLPEHQAQLINHLKASNISVGLLVNFGSKKVEYKRFQFPLPSYAH